MLATKDEKEKRKSEFYLHSILSNAVSEPLPRRFLSQFIGTYPDVTIYIEKGKLLCKNNEDKNVSELKHIINSLFKIDINAQIEFLKDKKGQFSLIKIYLNDGSVFEEAKK